MACPHCRHVSLLVAPADDAPLVCPRCGRTFVPTEQELLDPEDD